MSISGVQVSGVDNDDVDDGYDDDGYDDRQVVRSPLRSSRVVAGVVAGAVAGRPPSMRTVRAAHTRADASTIAREAAATCLTAAGPLGPALQPRAGPPAARPRRPARNPRPAPGMPVRYSRVLNLAGHICYCVRRRWLRLGGTGETAGKRSKRPKRRGKGSPMAPCGHRRRPANQMTRVATCSDSLPSASPS